MRWNALLFMLAGATASATAQAHPLEGKWSLDYPIGARMTAEGRTPVMGKGALEIVSVGDSLIGTLTPAARPDGGAPPAVRLAGSRSTGTVTLHSQSSGQVNVNGEVSTVTVTRTWALQAAGDQLSGTMTMVLEGMAEQGPPPTPEPVTGTRVKE